MCKSGQSFISKSEKKKTTSFKIQFWYQRFKYEKKMFFYDVTHLKYCINICMYTVYTKSEKWGERLTLLISVGFKRAVV